MNSHLATEPPCRVHPAETPTLLPPTVAAAVAVLEQGEAFLAGVGTEAYTRRHAFAFDASVGGHYRHCLDHFTSLLRARDGREVNYDQRDRDAEIEASPEAALEVTRQLKAALAGLSPDDLEVVVPARCAVSYGEGCSPAFGSSLGRELVYVIAHAIHHYALIAVVARLAGIPVPKDFGIAPSTVAHRARMGDTGR